MSQEPELPDEAAQSPQPDGPQQSGPSDQCQPGESTEQRRVREQLLWESIIANYGEGPSMAPPVAPPDPFSEDPFLADPFLADPFLAGRDPDRFTPPTPPPVPVPPLPRLIAWIGVLGMPVLALLWGVIRSTSETLADWAPPALISFGLFAWFVGGFAYLVSTMRRAPDDFDDGAQI